MKYKVLKQKIRHAIQKQDRTVFEIIILKNESGEFIGIQIGCNDEVESSLKLNSEDGGILNLEG